MSKPSCSLVHKAFVSLLILSLLILISTPFSFEKIGFHPSFSRHGITRASSILLIWLNENVEFHPSFSRHGITRASSVLLIWLNENVEFHPSFSRHGITRASSVLLIWLNENVHFHRLASKLSDLFLVLLTQGGICILGAKLLQKQRVVLLQTTCRFTENDGLF